MSEQPAAPDTDLTWWQMFRSAPRVLRWSAYVVAGLAASLVLLLVIATGFVLRPVAETDGEVELPGLAGEVEVIRDASGIAQVYADTDADLLRAQGYVHAQERFFEMDVRRHVTSGRLSELFGSDCLVTDK
ncbi:penicillin acylase family protein, partial [Nocardioides sp. P5_C9_2]